MNNLRRVAPLLCLMLFATGAASKVKEVIEYSMEPGWKIGNYSEVRNKYTITEFIPEGDDINNWKELFTVQNFAKSRGDSSAEKTLDALKANREKMCPGATEWNVIQKDKDSILYEWHAKPCLGWPEQHEIARIIDGKYNRFFLHYAAKVHELPPDTRTKWIDRLTEAAIVSKSF